MKIMVTGATGAYGSYALTYLQRFAPEAELYGLVRNPAKAEKLRTQGVHVRIGDYTDRQSLINAFKGIDRLLFVSVAVPGVQKNVVDAATINHVDYVAYTSIYRPELAKFGLEQNHLQTEQWLTASGLTSTFLRNDWYLEVNQALFDFATKTNQFVTFAPNGTLSFALKREYAEAGARVISNATPAPQVVNLAGKPVTYHEIGVATQTALGQALQLKTVSEADFMATMAQAGIATQWAGVADAYQKFALDPDNGAQTADSTEFEQVLGHRLADYPTKIGELIRTK